MSRGWEVGGEKGFHGEWEEGMLEVRVAEHDKARKGWG
jgi:hypothetical protein